MEKSEEEIEIKFVNEIINRKPKEVTEEDIKKGFELLLKRDFNLTDESIKLIYEIVESKRISISNLQRELKLGYSRAAAIFDKIIYL